MIKKYISEFQPRWRHRQKPFASSHNQKEDDNQSKINKQPEVLEIKTAWNSDNQGIKETVNKNQLTGKNPQRGGGPLWQGWLNRKLRLSTDCGLWQLPWWEKLSVSHESSLESGLEMSRGVALFPLWTLHHKQHHSTARRVALPW